MSYYKKVFMAYERASGQMINLEKSSFMMSKNVGRREGQELGDILGVRQSDNLGSYLGMPSQTSKNKRQLFSKIKGKVEILLQGWKERLFSAGGKEVLIKAVIQAIPTYTMSYSKLPTNLCNEINMLCAKFWWGSAGDKRKMHWAKWKELCKAKDFGGLGFRDIHLFNQAMLAKQSWRLLRFPDSLLYKILRDRYFRDGDFLRAQVGVNSSQTWKSIVWGRDLFKEGYRWKVGNGRHIYIKHDPWLIRKGLKNPIITPEGLEWARVEDLIKEGQGWNEELIRGSFTPIDAEDILAIPIARGTSKDEIIWDMESKGHFTVKSAYHLAYSRASKKEAFGSSNEHQRGAWRTILNLNVLPQIKIGIWKLLKNYIPSKPNLLRRGLDINPVCSLCRSKKETPIHSL